MITDLFFPPLCVGCEKEVTLSHTLCEECWQQLNFCLKQFCLHCSKEEDLEQEMFFSNAPCCVFNEKKGLSLFYYDDVAKDLILKLKHADATYLTRFFEPLFKTLTSCTGIETVDAFVPVPLHWKRYLFRQYNQSVLLCKILEKITGVFWKNVLKRKKFIKSQGTLGSKEREKNVEGAFDIQKDSLSWLKNKRLILVDDVWTTGSTARECAKTLLTNGAHSVKVITLCKVAPKT